MLAGFGNVQSDQRRIDADRKSESRHLLEKRLLLKTRLALESLPVLPGDSWDQGAYLGDDGLTCWPGWPWTRELSPDLEPDSAGDWDSLSFIFKVCLLS